MPRHVDHAERRTAIAEALVRAAGRTGLHAVGMRDVAAEAGVSLRLVQYYFESKEKLLLFGLRHLVGKFGERVTARVRAAGAEAGPRAVIEALLMAALPTDEESRVFHHLYTSYAILAVTDETLAAQPFIKDPDAAEATVAELLARAATEGLLRAGVDARAEAVGLLAMSAGLGTSILVGQRSPRSAAGVLSYHLDRIFLPRPPGGKRAGDGREADGAGRGGGTARSVLRSP
ncbi:TetR/AcrR family transcriptional regulator [Streptomyces sp. NPDC015220]|uniref:TetR/AcrR family transcriptional regulator n=1 Tax=Streptomyces sp. NPDC015220 TaxID=3364947 RepID=UPI003700D058